MHEVEIPYGIELAAFRRAAESVDQLIEAVNVACESLGLDEIELLITTPATLSALISDLFAGALAAESGTMTVNTFHNGHPDLVPTDLYPGDGVRAGEEGIEIKASKNQISDAHGARAGWWCQVRYEVDARRDVPKHKRGITHIRQVCLLLLTEDDFRRNARNTDTGTRTATPAREALHRLNDAVVYDASWY